MTVADNKRLFVLARLPLQDLLSGSHSPRAGDIVAILRAGLDADGSASADFASRGVTVIDGEALVSADDAMIIDDRMQDAPHQWYMDGEADISSAIGVSLGRLMSPQIKIFYNFSYLVRAGLIFRRLLDRYPNHISVLTDIRNGEYFYSDGSRIPECLLWRSMLGDFARREGRHVEDLDVTNGLLPFFRQAQYQTVLRLAIIMGRNAVQRLRRRAPKNASRAPGQKSVLFLQQNRLQEVADRLYRHHRLHICSDEPIAGASLPPWSSLLPIPPAALLRAFLRLRRHARNFTTATRQLPSLQIHGIDFSPYMRRVVAHLMRHQSATYLLHAVRTFRLMKALDPSAVVVSSDYPPAVMTASQLAHGAGKPVFFVNHGYDLAPCTVYASRRADRETIYLAEGESMGGIYGYWLPEGQKPRTLPATSTALAHVAHLRPPSGPIRRILATSYSSYTPHTIVRSANYDTYVLGLVEAARLLHGQGMAMTYRPHPAEQRANVARMLKTFDPDGLLTLDDSPTFEAALAESDLYVCNATTCYYQALAAGWPSIFFEPAYDRRFFFGLPADERTGRPLARSGTELAALIQAATDPVSTTSGFFRRFHDILRPQYIGQGFKEPATTIADSIATALRGQP